MPLLLSHPIISEVESLSSHFSRYLATSSQNTNKIISHAFDAGGKRIRPAIFLLFCDLFDYTGDSRHSIAAVCEFIHQASLLHDDVIDNSPLRRGKPTVNKMWTNQTAVLTGDHIYSTASRMTVKTRNFDIIDTFAKCIQVMSEGELFQLELLWKPETTEDEYKRVVHAKTAVLFEACAKTPSYLANLPEHTTKLCCDFGMHLGFAFQLVDDILDYNSTEHAIGKPVLADLREGKITLPLIHGMQTKTPEAQTLLHLVCEVSRTQNLQPHHCAQIHTLASTSQGVRLAKQQASKHIASAKETLNALWSTLHSPNETQTSAKDALLTVLDQVLSRKC